MGNTVKKPNRPKKSTNDDQTIWLIVGGLTLVLGGVGYWYYRKRKKQQEGFSMGMGTSNNVLGVVSSGSSGSLSNPANSTTRPSRFRCSSSSYPLQYSTCHRDVKVLQAYLVKIYKADIGASGRNKDGVDGMFGNKTSRAAKKHLGKVSFNKEDIDGMRKATKMIQG